MKLLSFKSTSKTTTFYLV